MNVVREACITGIGQSEIGRRLYRDPLELTLDGCLAAVADAGLTIADIDGLSTYPGNVRARRLQRCRCLRRHRRAPAERGLVRQRPRDIRPARLGHQGDPRGRCRPRQPRVVLPVRVGGLGAGQQGPRRGDARAVGRRWRRQVVPRERIPEWNLPFAAPSAAIWIALYAQRHFHEFGTTREQLAQIALNARRNAALNPNSIYSDPMSMDDYFAARMISTPLCLFDCDAPCDGATAFVVSRRDRARRHCAGPIRSASRRWERRCTAGRRGISSTTSPRCAIRDAGRSMWGHTDLTPDDVDIVELYDGFSILTVMWLEALGFCGRGEGGPFIEGGARIARDGRASAQHARRPALGGSPARLRIPPRGMHPAVGRGRRPRQVPGDAPQIGVAAAGGGNTAGSLLLSRG